MRKLRVLLTGGGTGGHIYPLLAVAQSIQGWALKNGLEPKIRYFGSAGNYKTTMEDNGIKVSNIASSKFRRYASFSNVVDFFKFFLGFIQGLWKIYWFMPDVIFSKGGPGALSVVYAARFYFVPLVVHESDTVPGITNRISARKAKVVDLAFSAAAKYFGKVGATINFVGSPVRQELLNSMPSESAKAEFGLDPNKPVVLILGGSQGSAQINEFILANLEKLLIKFQILHIVGREKFPEYKQQYEFISKNFSPILKKNYKYLDYLDNKLSNALDAADLVISRGGAGSIFEIAAKGKPSIIIPYPESAGGHQRENAYAFAENGAAVVIEQGNLLSSIFISQVSKILEDANLSRSMSGAAKDFYQPKSAEAVASHVLEQWQR